MIDDAGAASPPQGEAALVDHFFRHESANLVAVLTRAFGFARLQLVEESVQEAMLIALRSWRQSGVPDNPAGWMHRVARNKTLDALRREKIHERAVSLAGRSTDLSEELLDEWLLEERLPDSLLRMIFVCCHPALDRGSQLAMTLNLLCGLSVAEVARGLLISTEAAKKRIQRARKRLAAEQVQLDLPVEEELDARVGAVLEVLYLMFNEGYSASTGDRPLRDDICEEAARLCHLLCEHRRFSSPAAHALLALMLFHGARLEARVDDAGAAVLLEEQDRSAWDRRLIGVADSWLHRASTPRPTRFHFEAAIAQIHCHAASVEKTPWPHVVALYDRLLSLKSSPIYALNRAIALGEGGDPEAAVESIESLRSSREMKDYYLLDCAAARLAELSGDMETARAALERALDAAPADHARKLIGRRLRRLG